METSSDKSTSKMPRPNSRIFGSLAFPVFFWHTHRFRSIAIFVALGIVVSSVHFQNHSRKYFDVIVIGSGLAGLTTALTVLERGGKVAILEKQHTLGGNSNRASSGINACCRDQNNDTLALFRQDTTISAGKAARPDLIEVLTSNSAAAVSFLQQQGVDLSLLAQLGGHSVPRTHRPRDGMVGAEIIDRLGLNLGKYSNQVKIFTDARVTQILDSNGNVEGIEYIHNGRKRSLYTSTIVLATGGFASDRSPKSLLAIHRPELLGFPATAGDFSTGDGIKLVEKLHPNLIDMEYIQLHPTGFVDPNDPTNPTKILAAEVTRGVGGILLNETGDRFCNELGLRSYVTSQMLNHDLQYKNTGTWVDRNPPPHFALILGSEAAEAAEKHIRFYVLKGLLKKVQGVHALAAWLNVPTDKLIETFSQYRKDAATGQDAFGKTSFRGLPSINLETETFYSGKVTPVLHYCMGGLAIDTHGRVLKKNGAVIPGLYAAGEVSGGVHGENRLGGNSLLECTVFGRIVGQNVPLRKPFSVKKSFSIVAAWKGFAEKELRTVPLSELSKHNNPQDCWVAIRGVVYDLTSFAKEHPAGRGPIHMYAGKDATETFDSIHNARVLERFKGTKQIVGKLLESNGDQSMVA
jgi:flavocytochrome c